jgi:hypothetical protein
VIDDADAKVKNAEQAEKDLLKAEESYSESKKAFKSGGMKKGFMNPTTKPKQKK